jgi:hypothetical protein
MDKTMTALADVTKGGCYVRLADGSIVPAEDEDADTVAGSDTAAQAAATAEGGPGGAVGTVNGDSQARPEDGKKAGARRAAAQA